MGDVPREVKEVTADGIETLAGKGDIEVLLELFDVEAGVEGQRPPAREEVRDARLGLPDRLWLVDYADPLGLARCVHTKKEATISALTGLTSIGGVAVRVTTLGTSGTIRAATDKYLVGGARRRDPAPKEAL